MCLKYESTKRRSQPGEGPCRGLLRDCDIFANLVMNSTRAPPSSLLWLRLRHGSCGLLSAGAGSGLFWQTPRTVSLTAVKSGNSSGAVVSRMSPPHFNISSQHSVSNYYTYTIYYLWSLRSWCHLLIHYTTCKYIVVEWTRLAAGFDQVAVSDGQVFRQGQRSNGLSPIWTCPSWHDTPPLRKAISWCLGSTISQQPRSKWTPTDSEYDVD